MEIVEIEWLDSKGVTSSWEHKDELEPLEPVTVKSIGYLLESKDNCKVLVQSQTEEQVLGRIAIPVVSIKKQRIIK